MAFRTLQFQGCRLGYRIEGQGEPLVMIQGVAAFGLARVNPQLAILKQQYSCLSFDNRGCGESQPASSSLTIDQMAQDTLALMKAAGWTSAHIVGHSLGGMVALRMATIARHQVRSLSLLCSFARPTRITPQLVWIGLRMKLGTRQMRREAFLELAVADKQRQGNSEELLRQMSDVIGHDVADLPAVANQQISAIGREDFTPHLAELAGIPTLVVNGTNDPVAPPLAGRALAAGIPGARYVEIPGASHALPVLQARECADLVLEHLAAAERRHKPSINAP
ncbi:MAG TPA: alpha/beta fold hydrolase [Bryobacteraceae bacterium]|nr:alpha/beta fold hydrolase [Bryobacteraceae bacterium]